MGQIMEVFRVLHIQKMGGTSPNQRMAGREAPNPGHGGGQQVDEKKDQQRHRGGKGEKAAGEGPLHDEGDERSVVPNRAKSYESGNHGLRDVIQNTDG